MKKIIFSIACLLVLLAPPCALARVAVRASLPSPTVQVGAEIRVPVFVSSDQPLNAYDISLSFNPTYLIWIGADIGESIVDVWPEQPHTISSGHVSFKGVSLMPFVGERGALFTAIFRAQAVGTSTISDARSIVYLGNGKGTKVIPDTETHIMTVIPSFADTPSGTLGVFPASTSTVELYDTAAPEIVFVTLASDPITPGRKLLAFVVRDHGSGIVLTSARARSWVWWGDWYVVRNPTAYGNEVWSVEFTVTDRAGNRTTKVMYDWMALFLKLLPFALFAVFAIGVDIVYRRRTS